jgi:homoserine O-acetyltransferase
MTKASNILACLFSLLLAMLHATSAAQTPPSPVEGAWVARNFTFHNGSVLPELRMAYTTLGDPKNEAIVVLHGTTGTGKGMLGPDFGGQLFGPGQAFDASRYFIVLPDSIGTGRSSKPSDGLAAKFPAYNYHDMVRAYHLLLTQGLGLQHVRLIIGNSMGGMHTWMFGGMYPTFADILVPMASMPIEMSGRNWMTRRLIIDTIRNDPGYEQGFYKVQPKSTQFASVMYSIATNGGTHALQRLAPTREAADKHLDALLKAPFRADANDILYQWDASRDYAPEAGLDATVASVLMINSADDERNPPDLARLEPALKRVRHLKTFIIPGTDQTAGHGTTAQAKWWAEKAREMLATAPRLSKP